MDHKMTDRFLQHVVPADQRAVPADAARLRARVFSLMSLIFAGVSVVAAWHHLHLTTGFTLSAFLFYHWQVEDYIGKSRAAGGNVRSQERHAKAL